MATDLRDRLAAYLVREKLFPEPGTALVCVSGGPDSVALLYLLSDLVPMFGLRLLVAHVDHGIATGSAQWARQVEELATGLGLRTVVARLHLGAGTSETRARRARYRALRRLQREAGGVYLVTAHHADDQVETVLYRLFRGSGPAGLAGIPERGPSGLVRPLLAFSKQELAQWMAGRAPGTPTLRDPANADPVHDRTWVRQTLLPLVAQRYPDVAARLLSVARQAADERAAWRALLLTDAALALREIEGGVEVARGPFARYDKALSAALLRALARHAGFQLSAARAARLVGFVAAAPSGRRLDLGQRWSAEVVFDRLRLVAPSGHRRGEPPEASALGVGEAGEAQWSGWCIRWEGTIAELSRRAAWSTWVTPGPLEVRGVRAGERMRPLGGVGRRPVRRLLMEARIPRSERRRHPVVARAGEALWIPGVCRSDAALPRPGQPAVRLDARPVRDP